MVSIDYRLYTWVTEEQILEMLKSIGYIFVRNKSKALKKGKKSIAAKEFIRAVKNGRYHIFVEFSKKSSGNVASPQVDIHAHYDIFKKKGDKDIHVTRQNIPRDLDEMYNIHEVLKQNNYGYMEFKSKNSAHNTIKNSHKSFLLTVLAKKYAYDRDGKYKKKFPEGQITFQIIEQKRYSHLVCVYAVGIEHDLIKKLAQEELNRILELTRLKVKEVEKIKELHKALKARQKRAKEKLSRIKEKRDFLNAKTQEFIISIKELNAQISDKKNVKKKNALYKKRRVILREFTVNKKNAEKAHSRYLKAVQRIKKLTKKIKTIKKKKDKLKPEVRINGKRRKRSVFE